MTAAAPQDSEPKHVAEPAEVLAAFRDLLARNGRLSAQLRLFDALRAGPRTAASLLSLGCVDVAGNARRADAARRAVHERARALGRSLDALNASFGPRIGRLCSVVWNRPGGDGREYGLRLAPTTKALAPGARAELRRVRELLARFVEHLDRPRGGPEFGPRHLDRITLQVQVLMSHVLRDIRNGE